MPDDLKKRLKAFVPKPAVAEIKTSSELPAVYDLPWSRWNAHTGTEEEDTEAVPLGVHKTELTAKRELLSVLRLIDSGKVAVSDKTRRPVCRDHQGHYRRPRGRGLLPRPPGEEQVA